jgi:hypothetical protein
MTVVELQCSIKLSCYITGRSEGLCAECCGVCNALSSDEGGLRKSSFRDNAIFRRCDEGCTRDHVAVSVSIRSARRFLCPTLRKGTSVTADHTSTAYPADKQVFLASA